MYDCHMKLLIIEMEPGMYRARLPDIVEFFRENPAAKMLVVTRIASKITRDMITNMVRQVVAEAPVFFCKSANLLAEIKRVAPELLETVNEH